jgi:hypothetical protein
VRAGSKYIKKTRSAKIEKPGQSEKKKRAESVARKPFDPALVIFGRDESWLARED